MTRLLARALAVSVLALAALPATATSAPDISGARAKAFVARLAALGPRPAGSLNEVRAAKLVKARFLALGYRVSIQRFRLPDGRYSRNVVGRSPGTPRAIVVAHLDGVHEGPAANDNASGVAAMLEVAAALRRREGVLFAALGAEERVETGSRFHLGSVRFMRSLPLSVRRRVRLALSLDMVGVGTRLAVRGIERSPNRSARLARARARALGFRVTYLRDDGFSDHAEMTRGGIPAGWLQWRSDACWHEPCDRARRVRAVKLAVAAWLAFSSARAVISAP